MELEPPYQSLKWSIIAFAAENTELPPLTDKTYPPLFCILGIYWFYNHYLSAYIYIDYPLIFILLIDGYCVKEWLPKMYTP